MKKKWILGIVLGFFGIIIACSLQRKYPTDLSEFRENFAQLYDIIDTAVLTELGVEMDFSKGTVEIETSEDPDLPLLLNIFMSGGAAGNTLDSIYFNEHDKNDEYQQKITIHSATNATLKNVAITPVSGSPIFNAIGLVRLDLDTQTLFYNDIAIATKQKPFDPDEALVDFRQNLILFDNNGYRAASSSLVKIDGWNMDFLDGVDVVLNATPTTICLELSVSSPYASTMTNISFVEGRIVDGVPQTVTMISSIEGILNNLVLVSSTGVVKSGASSVLKLTANKLYFYNDTIAYGN